MMENRAHCSPNVKDWLENLKQIILFYFLPKICLCGIGLYSFLLQLLQFLNMDMG